MCSYQATVRTRDVAPPFLRSPLHIDAFERHVLDTTDALRIVYFGVGLGGKASNLLALARSAQAGALVWSKPLDEEPPTTIWYDRLRLVSNVSGASRPIEIYTLSGRVANPHAWRVLLCVAHGVVLVVDSQVERLDANAEVAASLDDFFDTSGTPLPIVIQYNKRDLPNAAPIVELSEVLNRHAAPEIEAVAPRSEGVAQTLDALLRDARFV
jgi:hypothetical protein